MRKRRTIIRILGVFLFIIISVVLVGQQEFFNDRTGISAGYAQALGSGTPYDYALATGFYMKNGLAVEVGLQQIEVLSVPIVSVGYFVKQKDSKNLASPNFGLSYGYTEEYHLFALNFGISSCFFREARFPFALDGKISFQPYFGNKEKHPLTVGYLLGLGYTQALYRNKIAYPFVGFQWGYEVAEDIIMLSLLVGMNINLW
jgi:hypothetical protein